MLVLMLMLELPMLVALLPQLPGPAHCPIAVVLSVLRLQPHGLCQPSHRGLQLGCDNSLRHRALGRVLAGSWR